MPSRRQVLATGAVGLGALLAGCVEPAGVLTMATATTDEIVSNATLRVDGTDAEDRSLLEDLLENGSATAEGRRPPLGVERPIAYEGDVYALSVAEVGERTRIDFVLEVDFDPEEPTETAVAFEDLPAVDRERLAPLLEREPPTDNDGIDVGARVVYADEEREASVLVPDQEVTHVAVDGEVVRVRTEPTETTLTTFEYAITDRLGSEAAYAEDLLAEYRFALTGLSADERAVVEEAIDEGRYYASSSSDEAFEGVARAFLEHEPVTNDEFEGSWLASYDGTTYWADLDFLQYRDLRDRLPAA